MTTDAPALKLTVTTVPQLTVAKGYIQVTANTRSSTDKDGKKKEIPADQRSRSIIIPEFQPAVSSKYVSLVTSALATAAKEQLAQQWKAEPMLREVDAALYTEDSILAFCAREAESKKLTGAAILAWLDQSELGKYVASKNYDAATLKNFRDSLENIAAPQLSVKHYNEEKALKRIALLGKHESDTEHEVCAAMIRKLTNYVEDIQKSREAIGDVAEVE